MISLRKEMRILLLECIAKDDRIYHESKLGLNFIREHFQGVGPVSVDLREVDTPSELRHAIRECRPDILVLSAHGAYEADRRLAQIVVGKTLCLGPELGPMPPLVILSACSVAPRGGGAVNIAELLMREGAFAVLGAQVPVHVRRNVRLTVRFLVYLVESARGTESHLTVADAWHRTSSLNAILDIVQSSPYMDWWAHVRKNGKQSPIEQFMNHYSRGRLRSGHAYADTERIFLEIGDSEGMPDSLRRVIQERDYVPETLFYFLLGWPERIRLNDPVIAQYDRSANTADFLHKHDGGIESQLNL